MNTRDLHIQVVALQALVMGVLVAMAKKDPKALLEIINDPGITDVSSLPELANFPDRDKKRLQYTLDRMLRPLRTAVTPPGGSA